jgi:protein-tyrosine phosphatase
MRSVLFICTGNIFRSVAAEYALKAQVGPAAQGLIGSAGIEALPQPLDPLICDRLRQKGADPSGHVQRKLTRQLLERVEVPVAMGLDHRDFIRRHFGRDVLLFNELCCGTDEPVLDVHEAIPDWHRNPAAARAYVLSVIEFIWNAMPALLARLSSR